MSSSVASDEVGGPGTASPHPSDRGHQPPSSEGATVLCCYVPGMLHPETDQAIGECGLPVQVVAMDPDWPGNYAQVLHQFLENTETLVVVEQDIVPAHGQITELATCPEPWCWADYHVGGSPVTPKLGLAKFDRSMIDRWPDWPSVALWHRKGKQAWTHWQSANEDILRHLTALGYRAHRHEPDVGHLHDYGDGHNLTPGPDESKMDPVGRGDGP